MKAKWVVVVAFYAVLIVAVAQSTSKTADLLWIGGSFAMLTLLSACRVVECLRSGDSKARGRRGLMCWYYRFVTDSDRKEPHSNVYAA